MKRLLRHLFMTPLQMHRAFPAAALAEIAAAVESSEARHGGEIRVAIEADLPLGDVLAGQTPRERAIQVFAELGVWDTAARNGVLLYVCLADRDVEIVADRGFQSLVHPEQWAEICGRMEVDFAAGKSVQAVLAAIGAIGDLIAAHYPTVDRNELSNRPVLL